MCVRFNSDSFARRLWATAVTPQLLPAFGAQLPSCASLSSLHGVLRSLLWTTRRIHSAFSKYPSTEGMRQWREVGQAWLWISPPMAVLPPPRCAAVVALQEGAKTTQTNAQIFPICDAFPKSSSVKVGKLDPAWTKNNARTGFIFVCRFISVCGGGLFIRTLAIRDLIWGDGLHISLPKVGSRLGYVDLVWKDNVWWMLQNKNSVLLKGMFSL